MSFSGCNSFAGSCHSINDDTSKSLPVHSRSRLSVTASSFAIRLSLAPRKLLIVVVHICYLLARLNLYLACMLILSHCQKNSVILSMIEAMTCLLQEQTDAMVAQTKVTAVQHLPNLPLFTGEERNLGEDTFDKWVEKFRERAQFTGWSVK